MVNVSLEIPSEIISWRQRHAMEFLINHFAFTQPIIYKWSGHVSSRGTTENDTVAKIQTWLMIIIMLDNVIVYDVLSTRTGYRDSENKNRNFNDKSCLLDIAILFL